MSTTISIACTGDIPLAAIHSSNVSVILVNEMK